MRRTKDVAIKMCRFLELLDNFRDKNPFLVSIFRNFGFAELTIHSEMKRKRCFLLHFSRFFLTLQKIQTAMLIKSFKTLQNKAMNSILAKTAVVLFLMAFTASSAWAVDYTAGGQTISNATTWKNCTVNIWGSGKITFSQRITISGTVTLYLDAGTTLVASQGIELAECNTLTIEGNGALTASGASGKSGIGSQFFGALVVNGGTITATGGSGAAGIGSDLFSWTMGHTNDGVTINSNKGGIIEGTPWSWDLDGMGGSRSLTYYDNGTYWAEWTNSAVTTVSMGYNYGNGHGVNHTTKRYAVDYKYAKTGSGGTYGYIGVHGWTENPLTEYYIIDDWYENQINTQYVGPKLGELFVDGATYSIHAFIKEQEVSPVGTSTFLQIFSIRETPRQQGHISISAHFREFDEIFRGQTFNLPTSHYDHLDIKGKFGHVTTMELYHEIGGNATGSVDYTYFRMTDNEKSNITINGGTVIATGGTGASGIGAASNGGSPGMLALGERVTIYGGSSSNPTGNTVYGPVNDITTRYRYMRTESSSGISTGINSMNPSTDEPIYFNLQGQRVDHPTWGIYIRQQGKVSKKVVLKN